MYNSNKYQLPVASLITVTATAYHSDDEDDFGDDIRASNIIEVAVSPSHKISQQQLSLAFAASEEEPIYSPPDEVNAKEFLTDYKWPCGLQDALINSCKKIAIRFIIVDDSGSMLTEDGHRLVGTGTQSSKIIPCTRWDELSNSLKFHAELAHQCKAPTEFRLLNNSEPILVGHPNDVEGAARDALMEVRPLC